jgi:LacI family transcriptional regulator
LFTEVSPVTVTNDSKRSHELQRRPTMGDVARLAGVGTMSVSRLLNDSGPVSAESAAKIRWAVQKLDYRLNEVARSLRGQRSRMIGVIVPNLSNPFFGTCAHEIDLAAKAHGYTVAVANSGDERELEHKEAHELVQRNVDGLIVVPADSTDDYFSRSIFADTPVVFLDRPGADPSRDSVLVQNREGVRMAVEHLLNRGHNRIAFLGIDKPVQTLRVRYQAYRQIMKSHNLAPLPYICPASHEVDARVVELLKGAKAPTAILTAHGPSTIGLLSSFRRLKLNMPRDVALVGFDEFDTSDLVEPGISTICQPVRQLARVSSELLFRRLIGELINDKPVRVVLPVELVVRGSSDSRRGSQR